MSIAASARPSRSSGATGCSSSRPPRRSSEIGGRTFTSTPSSPASRITARRNAGSRWRPATITVSAAVDLTASASLARAPNTGTPLTTSGPPRGSSSSRATGRYWLFGCRIMAWTTWARSSPAPTTTARARSSPRGRSRRSTQTRCTDRIATVRTKAMEPAPTTLPSGTSRGRGRSRRTADDAGERQRGGQGRHLVEAAGAPATHVQARPQPHAHVHGDGHRHHEGHPAQVDVRKCDVVSQQHRRDDAERPGAGVREGHGGEPDPGPPARPACTSGPHPLPDEKGRPVPAVQVVLAVHDHPARSSAGEKESGLHGHAPATTTWCRFHPRGPAEGHAGKSAGFRRLIPPGTRCWNGGITRCGQENGGRLTRTSEHLDRIGGQL